MKIKDFGGKANEVAIIFGRFNPPHKGHKAAWEIASQSPYWYVGTNKSTQGPKDPLPYNVKVQAMVTVWPEVAKHIVAETSWLSLAAKVYAKHGKVKLFCLTDEAWVTDTIKKYNGVEGPHGVYDFISIEQRPTPRLSSATAVRDAVAKGDRKAFTIAAGIPADTLVGKVPFFDLVAKYLLPYMDKPSKKKLKESKLSPWDKMEKALPDLKVSDQKSQVAIANIKQANKDYEEITKKKIGEVSLSLANRAADKATAQGAEDDKFAHIYNYAANNTSNMDTGKSLSKATKLRTLAAEKNRARAKKFTAYADKKRIAEQDTEGNGRITGGDLKRLARYINTFFEHLGLDVKFTKHFFQRVNDPRNKQQITIAELIKLFKDEYQKWGNKISELGKDAEAVLKDMSTDINVPVVLAWDAQRQDLDLVAKTVMRKKDFKSYTPILAVENINSAITIHETLNPRLFMDEDTLSPVVRDKLLDIAYDFKAFLGIELDGFEDITISGSNAAYTYTPNSDIDVHLVVDLPDADTDPTFRELFDAKKFQYNSQHNFKVRGYDVELYVQNANQEHISQGVYSLLDNNWIKKPSHIDVVVDESVVQEKYDTLKNLIGLTIKTQNFELGSRLRQIIKKYRAAGLQAHGEFGPENLAFKMLRNKGYIEKLYKFLNLLKDKEMSLDEKLTEVDMSPGTLQQFSSTEVAQNTLVGFEFEMIVPDVTDADEDGDMALDYDTYDDFVSSGSVSSLTTDLINFFNDTATRREVEEAVEEANEKILEYMDEQFDDYLRENRREVVEKIRQNEPDFSEEDANASIDDGDASYADAVDELRDDFYQYWDDLDGALRQLHLRKYSDWSNKYGLPWPYYRSEAPEFQVNAHSMSELAVSIEDVIGMKVVGDPEYHSVRNRAPDVWYLETDSSIQADRSEGEGGLELISPPLPLPVAMEKMDKVFRWMDLNGARTDASTGFHINVSIPNMDKVDYTKLILFLGDEYVLREFGRQANSYTVSAMTKMKRWNGPGVVKNVPNLFNSLRAGMDKAGMAVISSMLAPRGEKYTSVNIKEKYIEFRSAGGNYLDKIDQIKNTLMRYVRVINLAADPNEAKEEYAKKLYKLLMEVSPEKTDDSIKLFSLYATGNIPKQYLIDRIKQQQAARQAKKNAPPQVEPTYRWTRWIGYDSYGVDRYWVSAQDAEDAQRRILPLAQRDGITITDIRPDEDTREPVTEGENNDVISEFIQFACEKLGIKQPPEITRGETESSFGHYDPNNRTLSITTMNRHPMDAFRTLAHELVHHKQNEEGRLTGPDDGADGSDIENEANSKAGVIMREFGKMNPHYFSLQAFSESKQFTSFKDYLEESHRPFVWKKEEPKEELTEMQKACILGGHEYVGELKGTLK